MTGEQVGKQGRYQLLKWYCAIGRIHSATLSSIFYHEKEMDKNGGTYYEVVQKEGLD